MEQNDHPPGGEKSGDVRRYRCPVCGHTDGVVMRAAGEAHIRCSHCDAPLDVHLGSTDSERVTVQVSKDQGA